MLLVSIAVLQIRGVLVQGDLTAQVGSLGSGTLGNGEGDSIHILIINLNQLQLRLLFQLAYSPVSLNLQALDGILIGSRYFLAILVLGPNRNSNLGAALDNAYISCFLALEIINELVIIILTAKLTIIVGVSVYITAVNTRYQISLGLFVSSEGNSCHASCHNCSQSKSKNLLHFCFPP